MHMKKQLPILAAVALGLAAGAPAVVVGQTTANKPAQVKDAEAVSNLITVTAVVQAVDLKNRVVTLTGPEGNTFSVLVDEKVKNLPQVKVGDVFAVTYYESVALDFQKGDGIRMATVIDDSQRAKAGQKPGAGAFTRVTVVSNIWAIDQAKGKVLVRGPYGHFAEVKLKDPSLLTGVKVGDQMKVTFTQAVAIGFEKPAQ
jgi:Cu/Ag efflux protein CusF